MLPAYQYGAMGPVTNGHSSSDGAGSRSISAGQGLLVLYNFISCELSVTVGSGVGLDVLQEASDGGVAPVLEQYVQGRSGGSQSSSGLRGLSADERRLGGKLRLAAGEALQLQVFLDYSLLEVFAGDGQVLSTRVYRGCSDKPAAGDSSDQQAAGELVPGGVWLLSGAGAVDVKDLHMHGMCSIWDMHDG